MEWKTLLVLARVTNEGSSTNAKYEQVLLVDGQYDVIPVDVSSDGITLTLPAEARDAELKRKPELLDLPIHVVYAE